MLCEIDSVRCFESVSQMANSGEPMNVYYDYIWTSVKHSLLPHHNRFTALFPGPLWWASARRGLLDFMVQGEINRGRHTDHPAGRHSIWTNQCLSPLSPHIFTGRNRRMPFLPPKQHYQSIEGN